MKSAKSCFNKALFFKNIKRFWPVWVLYNIAWLIGMPLVLLSQLSSSYPEIVNGYVLSNALYMGVITNAIFGFVSALTLFSYLYTSRSVGAFHTLPIRREGLFLTCFLSGLCWLFVSNLFIFALSAVVELIYGALAIKYLLQWLAMVCLE
jgi:ABC-2 type transport system permease protein